MKMRLFYLLLPVLCNLTTTALSQPLSPTCGTEATDRYIRLLKDQVLKEDDPDRRSVSHYPATIHILRTSNGAGGMSMTEFEQIFSELNNTLSPSGVSLFVCQEINYVDNDTWYDFVKYDEHALTGAHYNDNTVNIYFPNSITTGGGAPLCGYAYFPGWQDVVIVDRHCALDGSTFTHEIGHYFGLLHTHGVSNVTQTDELTDYTNCISAGDDVCDTPADPNLTGAVNSDCMYTGNATDPLGNPYDPDPSNIMSYAPKPCRDQLTDGQYNRISYVAAHLRDYLGCTDLTASFQVSDPMAFCLTQHTTTFTYTGSGATSVQWDIGGDGTIDYSGESVDHTFQSPGRHTVCISVDDGTQNISRCDNDAVQILEILSVPYTEDFSGDLKGGINNPDHNYGWTHAQLNPNLAGMTLIVDNYHYNSSIEEDHFIFGPTDLNLIVGPLLMYDVAYAPYSQYREDGLRVEISTDCGLTWQMLNYSEGLDLATSGGYITDQWMPAGPGDWRTESIDLSAYGTDTTLIRFTNVAGFGNNLYIDNVSISQNPALDLEILSFEVLPHPEGHLLAWETILEENVTGYDIEISRDGRSFNTIDHIPVQHSLHNVYHYVNRHPPLMAFYRVTGVLTDGQLMRSPIRQLGSRQWHTLIYPNPVRGRLHIQSDNSTLAFQVFNASGSTVSLPPPVNESDNIYVLDVSILAPGIYTVVGDGITARFVKID